MLYLVYLSSKVVIPLFLLLEFFIWLMIFNFAYSKNLFITPQAKRYTQAWFITLSFIACTLFLLAKIFGPIFLLMLQFFGFLDFISRDLSGGPLEQMIALQLVLILGYSVLCALLQLADKKAAGKIIFWVNWLIMGPIFAFTIMILFLLLWKTKLFFAV